MHHHHLREIAKFASGLVAADFLCVLWFSAVGLFPITFLGLTYSSEAVLPIAAFDVVIFALLVHYGWRISLPVRSPKEKSFLILIGCILAVIAFVHLVRLAFGWEVGIGGIAIPQWLSWIGSAVAAFLSYTSFHFAFMRSAQ